MKTLIGLYKILFTHEEMSMWLNYELKFGTSSLSALDYHSLYMEENQKEMINKYKNKKDVFIQNLLLSDSNKLSKILELFFMKMDINRLNKRYSVITAR